MRGTGGYRPTPPPRGRGGPGKCRSTRVPAPQALAYPLRPHALSSLLAVRCRCVLTAGHHRPRKRGCPPGVGPPRPRAPAQRARYLPTPPARTVPRHCLGVNAPQNPIDVGSVTTTHLGISDGYQGQVGSGGNGNNRNNDYNAITVFAEENQPQARLSCSEQSARAGEHKLNPDYLSRYVPGLTDLAGNPSPEVVARLQAQQAMNQRAAAEAALAVRRLRLAGRWYTRTACG